MYLVVRLLNKCCLLLWSPGFACTFLELLLLEYSHSCHKLVVVCLPYLTLHRIGIQARSSSASLTLGQKVWSTTIGVKSGIPLQFFKEHPDILPTMASSQKPNTHSAPRSAAAWARASEGDAALGKPVALQDTDASLGLPIVVVDATEEMPPTFSPGPAGNVVDLTPELAEKIRAETDQVQCAEATGLRLPRPVSLPVERALPPVVREDVSNAPMSSYLWLANRVQPPQPLSPGRLHPEVSADHPQPPRPESSSDVWEPELTDRRSAWPARAGVSIPQVVHSSEAISEVARPSSRQPPQSISVMTARNQPRALPDYTGQRVGASSLPPKGPTAYLQGIWGVESVLAPLPPNSQTVQLGLPRLPSTTLWPVCEMMHSSIMPNYQMRPKRTWTSPSQPSLVDSMIMVFPKPTEYLCKG